MNTLIIFVNSSSSTWSMTHKRSKDRWVGVTWPFFISQCSIQQLCRAEQYCLCGHCQLASWLQRHHSMCSEQASSHFHSWEEHPLVGCCGRCQNIRHPPKSSTWVWWSTAVDVAISWRLAHPLQLPESTSEDIWWCWASSVSKGSWPSICQTLKSLAQASHFKRTHHFILQSFEAIYCLFLRLYLHSLETTPEAPPSQIPPSQATPLSANPQVPTSPEVGTLQYIPVWNSVSVWYGCYSNLRKCNLYCANDCLHTLLGSCGSDI